VGNGTRAEAAVGELLHTGSENGGSGGEGEESQKTETKSVAHEIALNSSRIGADFHIDYRQKGLLWFSTTRWRSKGHILPESNRARAEDHDSVAASAKEAVYDGAGDCFQWRTAEDHDWRNGSIRGSARWPGSHWNNQDGIQVAGDG